MDNHHVTIQSSSSSCGILECSRMSEDNNKVLFQMASYLYHPSRGQPAAFYMWSTINRSLEEYINDIGFKDEFWPFGVNFTGPIENPKTGNNIWVFLWTIPHEEFKDWYQKERIKRINEQRG